MASLIIAVARLLVLGLVAMSAIVSMYAATNAVAVYTNHTVFTSGLMMVAAGALVNPLFCFLATYGLLRYSDVPVVEALALTLPACLAWCVAAARTLLAATAR